MSNGASAFDWADYIEFAKDLIGNGTSSEAAKRSAISRSYYGAFLLARNLADDKGWVTVTFKSTDHKNIKDYFTNHSTDLTINQIGQNLDRLRIDRNKVDYDNVCYGLDVSALKCVRRAEWVKNSLKKYR